MRVALKSNLHVASLTLALSLGPASALAGAGHFFDDFSYADTTQLRESGWVFRDEAGHPGVPGGRWDPSLLQLIQDPASPGKRLLRLQAETDGTPAGTRQAQLCQQRKFFRGTYAAHVRFSDKPQSGQNGDPVVQSFYTVAPLRFPFDPEYSEVDWEYVPNGAWGNAQARLYGLSWQTVRIEPWESYNSSRELPGSLAENAAKDGWHLLLMQVDAQEVRLFLDGQPYAVHAGRNVPAVPMSINFNLWFAPDGLLPPSAEPRVWREDLDWVFHAQDAFLDTAAVLSQVASWRAQQRHHVDTVRPPEPALPLSCNF